PPTPPPSLHDALPILVVHSAGGALGLDPVADAVEERWRAMYESNVLGVMLVTKALLPALRRSDRGHIVILGSIAGTEVYEGGARSEEHTSELQSRFDL